MLDRGDVMRFIQVRRDLGEAAMKRGAGAEATPSPSGSVGEDAAR
jgi:hypothetical protein